MIGCANQPLQTQIVEIPQKEFAEVLLIDKEMTKADLEREAHLTHYSVSKLSKNGDVSTDVLHKICSTLDCQIDDIIVKPQNKKVGKFLEGTKRVQQIKPVSAEFLRTG